MARFQLTGPAATEALGAALAAGLPKDPAGWTLLLTGDVGAGKSTLVRAMLVALGHEGYVPSPTYTLVEPYELAGTIVYHVDLYRVGGEEELRYLGWNELGGGLRLVEWPDRAPGLTAEADIDIRLAYADVGRSVEFVALSDRGRAWLEATGDALAEALRLPAGVSQQL